MLARRTFLRRSALAVSSLLSVDWPVLAGLARPGKPAPTILLRSSWQTINIGDIGHTPGALAIFRRYLPKGTRLILWPSSVDNGVAELLNSYFPDLTIAEGSIGPDGQPTTPALNAAFAEADLLVHGSGPSVLAQPHVAAWRKLTGKPYGIFGVTIGGELNDALLDLLNGAAFVYLRDTVSLKLLQEKGVRTPVLDFGPDATFAIPFRNEAKAKQYLDAVGLADKQFLCVIPRLRYTPYWKLHGKAEPNEGERKRDAISEEFKERDHAKLREAMMAWVRTTGLPVLACPEMTHEVPLAKELLVDPLPADVRSKVVWRDRYWLPDEATSVYARARAVVSFEMHSPIMAFQVGTPAFYLRQPTDTSKGQMWRDVGLSDWIFEIDAVDGAAITERLLAVHRDYPAALRQLKTAQAYVERKQRAMAEVVARVLRA
jgi:polysaccharide pyruvyl transferase WcaK-like protein